MKDERQRGVKVKGAALEELRSVFDKAEELLRLNFASALKILGIFSRALMVLVMFSQN